jgi:hypothetical protein
VVDRRIDWRAFLNKLVYCYGCGRFGMPRKGLRKAEPPRGWKVLYQPHPEAPAGLLVCSEKCEDKVRIAMAEGPVEEPLEIATNVTMTNEMREQMAMEAIEYAIREGHLDDMFKEALEGKDDG